MMPYEETGRIISDKEATYNMSHLEAAYLRFLGEKSQVSSCLITFQPVSTSPSFIL